jgi:hypothetical protein
MCYSLENVDANSQIRERFFKKVFRELSRNRDDILKEENAHLKEMIVGFVEEKQN